MPKTTMMVGNASERASFCVTESPNTCVAESICAACGKALAYQSGIFTGLACFCVIADLNSARLNWGAAAKIAVHKIPATAVADNTAATNSAIVLGCRSRRFVQRAINQMPSAAPRIAPKESTKPSREISTPPTALMTRFTSAARSA